MRWLKVIGLLMCVWAPEATAQNLVEVRIGLRTRAQHSMIRAVDVHHIVCFRDGRADTILGEYVEVYPRSSGGVRVDAVVFDELADSVHLHALELMTVTIGRYAAHHYPGKLVCRNVRNRIQTVLVAPRAEYLMGVVHAELGYLQHPELWKAQAVVANTWFQRNHDKFKSQGFQVTDDVRSQVFHGLPNDSSRLADLRLAVSQVEAHIIVDSVSPSDGPIEALFHANSGGQTMDCGWYFGPRPYLVSLTDEFSLDCKQTYWTKKLTVDQWSTYLARQLGQSPSDSAFVHWATNLPMGSRGEYLNYGGRQIRLRKVREYYRLRSTWFATRVDGDFVILDGRGYGHGIGMSQEGAHRMAMLGYSYEEILEFYYPHTLMIPLTKGEDAE